MTIPFVQKVRQYATASHILPDGQRVLVALSGGADSVALLHVLRALSFECRAVHCNFHLRGMESDRDEAFVRALCKKLDVPLDILHFHTTDYAARQKISIEMAARELRYDAFEHLRAQYELDAVAVAHHLEDSVETILMNLLRGTGIDGLTGIAPQNGFIVRPLLEVTRPDIEEYLKQLDQPWVDDSTNASDDYARNRIRHHLLPLMQELNPAALQNIVATACHLRGTRELLDKEATDEAAITVLHGVLHPHGYNETQVRNLLSSLKSRRQTLLPSGRGTDTPTLSFEVVPYDAAHMPRSNEVLCLDMRVLTAPLVLRRWQEGDRFQPFGMHGQSKLVSDLLTDIRLSREERERQQVLCLGDTIVWVVGIRSDERFRVPTDATRLLLIRCQNE